MDMITAYVFGSNNGTNFIELEDERNAWRAKYSIKWKMAFWCQEFASGKKLLEMLGVELVPPWMITAKREVEDWCMQMCLKAETDMRTQNVDEAEKVVYAHLLGTMNRASESKQPKSGMHRSQVAIEQERRNGVASEIMDHISKFVFAVACLHSLANYIMAKTRLTLINYRYSWPRNSGHTLGLPDL